MEFMSYEHVQTKARSLATLAVCLVWNFIRDMFCQVVCN